MVNQGLFGKTGIKQCVIQEIIHLAQKYDVQKVILFGSRARGDYKLKSDIDLAFQGGKGNYFSFDVDEETTTLLQFDIIDMDKTIKEELLESIQKSSRMELSGW